MEAVPSKGQLSVREEVTTQSSQAWNSSHCFESSRRRISPPSVGVIKLAGPFKPQFRRSHSEAQETDGFQVLRFGQEGSRKLLYVTGIAFRTRLSTKCSSPGYTYRSFPELAHSFVQHGPGKSPSIWIRGTSRPEKFCTGFLLSVTTPHDTTKKYVVAVHIGLPLFHLVQCACQTGSRKIGRNDSFQRE